MIKIGFGYLCGNCGRGVYICVRPNLGIYLCEACGWTGRPDVGRDK